MEPLEIIEALAKQARKETAPEVDVRRAVMSAIREPRSLSMAPFWIYVVGLAPTAAAVMLGAAQVWGVLSNWLPGSYWTGPLDSFLSPLRQVMP